MRAHRRAASFSLGTNCFKKSLQKIEKHLNFCEKFEKISKVLQKIEEQQIPYIFIITLFFQTGPKPSQKQSSNKCHRIVYP